MNSKSLLILAVWCVCAVTKAQQSYPSFYAVIQPQLNNSVIEIPKGTYAYDLDNPDPEIRFTNKKDVVINGNGSTIICSKPGRVFGFSYCENITVSGFTFDCYPRTSTQGTITSISSDNRTLEVEIHKGYEIPDPNGEESTGSILLFDKENRELMRNLYTAHAVGGLTVNSATRKVTFAINQPKSGVYKVGDYVTFSSFPNGTSNHLFESDYSKDMKFMNITVHDTRGATFLEQHCSNNYYYRCVVDRKLNDPLYEEDQLRTTAGDILHSFFCTKGPKVEECTFKYMCDDGINIGGFFYGVYKVNKARKRIYLLLTSDAWWIFTLKVGDSLVCVANDGSVQGKAKITAIDKPSTEPTEAEIKACTDKLTTIRDKALMTIGMSIQVDEWNDNFDNLTGGMVYTEDRAGNGFEIINCDIGHNRSRGILIKASNGVIKNNVLSGCSMPGIAIAPEYYWLEGGISNNLEITGNRIEDCCFDSDMLNSGQLAPLTVVSEAPKGGLTKIPVFENIIIHRNTVVGGPKPSVFLNAMSGYYYENTLEPDESMVRYHGYNLSVDNRAAYAEKYVGNIIKDRDPLETGIVSPLKNSDLIRISGNGDIVFTQPVTGVLAIYNPLGKLIISGELKNATSFASKIARKGIYIIHLEYGGSQSCTKKYAVI